MSKRAIGNLMLIAPFAAIFTLAAIEAGVIPALAIFAGIAALMAWLAVAVWLSQP